MYTFSFIVGNIIPRSVKCIHSATKKGLAVGRKGCAKRVQGLGVCLQGLWLSLGFASGFVGI